MVLRASWRRWLSAGLVGAIIALQMAVAAHVCARTPAAASAQSSEAPCPHGSAAPADPGDLGLCLQHCQFGTTQQPAGGDAAAAVPAAACALWYALPPDASLALADATSVLQHGAREVAQAPPPALSRLHRRYRL